MPIRYCPNCNKAFNQKIHYDNHINPNRKNACRLNESKIIQIDPNESKIIRNDKILNGGLCNKIICGYCDKSFTSRSNLNKHIINACKVKKLEDEKIQNQLKIMEIENKLIKEKLELSEKHCKTLEKENEYHKQLVNATGNLIQTSMSSLNYMITNFKDAPILESLEDYSIFEEEKKFIDNIIYYYVKGKLAQYIGDFLILKYKSEDPKKRQTWSTDISRITYINRSLVNDVPSWVVDKKGLSIIQIVIKPFVEYIKVQSQKTIKRLQKEMEETGSNYKSKKILAQMEYLNNIIQEINNKVLEVDINKYLASHLYFDKNKYIAIDQK